MVLSRMNSCNLMDNEIDKDIVSASKPIWSIWSVHFCYQTIYCPCDLLKWDNDFQNNQQWKKNVSHSPTPMTLFSKVFMQSNGDSVHLQLIISLWIYVISSSLCYYQQLTFRSLTSRCPQRWMQIGQCSLPAQMWDPLQGQWAVLHLVDSPKLWSKCCASSIRRSATWRRKRSVLLRAICSRSFPIA